MKERAVNQEETSKRWEQYGLPKELVGKTFLDVGCWGGQFCVEAVNRGAGQAVGIDIVQNAHVDNAIDDPISFLQMDVFSPHFLTLPRFDVVLCAGVLYHTPDPVGLLTRLKAVVSDNGTLYLETVIIPEQDYMIYCESDSYDNNFSNWFVPSLNTVTNLLEDVGFEFSHFVLFEPRAMFVSQVQQMVLPSKYLPRKKGYMK